MSRSLDTLCGALAFAMGIEPPRQSAAPNETLCRYLDKKLGGGKADRLFLYNPDAIARWICAKYPQFIRELEECTELSVDYTTVMPSVTPVCFGTFYTGAQPEVHGIRRYEKPVIRIDTLFDAALRAGKKPAIVADRDCSIGKIFLEREMDYFLFDNWDEVNAKASELILRDEHDLIVVYNGNFDYVMHRCGPESPEALGELRANVHAFRQFCAMIGAHWTGHRTLAAFAMDHGCHEIDGHLGSHGLDMPEDLEIRHFYKVF